MPRITGPTIAEHVAAQEAAVVDAAKRLFASRGVTGVSLGDIAAEVGLGRTSLYRYFPTKAHILQRWFDLEMLPLIEASREVVEAPGTPAQRLTAWIDVQLDFLTDESHAMLTEASAGLEPLPEEVREHFGQRHRELYGTLTDILRAGGARSADVQRARAQLIGGLLRSAAQLAPGGVRPATLRREIHRSALAVAGL
ncbi:MAG TPA: TetR/AcrR family transcriptional regulator [Angustibacter sp.]|nr:TetR/AcrR family transcriptional regulator [Angustibacter sp.]